MHYPYHLTLCPTAYVSAHPALRTNKCRQYSAGYKTPHSWSRSLDYSASASFFISITRRIPYPRATLHGDFACVYCAYLLTQRLGGPT